MYIVFQTYNYLRKINALRLVGTCSGSWVQRPLMAFFKDSLGRNTLVYTAFVYHKDLFMMRIMNN